MPHPTAIQSSSGSSTDASSSYGTPISVKSKGKQPAHRAASQSNRSKKNHPPEALLQQLIDQQDDQSGKSEKLLKAAPSQLEEDNQQMMAAARERLRMQERELRQANEVSNIAVQAQEELAKAQLELSMYKMRLTHAESEMIKAQKLLQTAENQRIEAEKVAATARRRARRLKEEKAVTLAHEDGRRQGFDQGIVQGRQLAIAREEARMLMYTDSNGYTPGPSAFIEEAEDTPRQAASPILRQPSRQERRQRPPPHGAHTPTTSRRVHRDIRREAHSSPNFALKAPSSPVFDNPPPRPHPPQPIEQRMTVPPAHPILPAIQEPYDPISEPTILPSAHAPEPTPEPVEEPLPVPPPVPRVSQTAQNTFSSLSRGTISHSFSPSPSIPIVQVTSEPPLVVQVPPPPSVPRQPLVPAMYLPMPAPPLPPPPITITHFIPQAVPLDHMQRARSSPDILNSPASSATSMTGLSSQLGSNLVSFPPSSNLGSRIGSSVNQDGGEHFRGLGVIPEDVSGGDRTPEPYRGLSRNSQSSSFNSRKSVEEWRNETARGKVGSYGVDPSPSSAGFTSASNSAFPPSSLNSAFLQPPPRIQPQHSGNSTNSFSSDPYRQSSGSGSIQFDIVPPSRPSSVVNGSADDVSGFLSPNHTPRLISAPPEPDEPPVIPNTPGTSTTGSEDPYTPSPIHSHVLTGNVLPPGFVPQSFISSPDPNRGNPGIPAYSSAAVWGGQAAPPGQQAVGQQYPFPMSMPIAMATPTPDELSSTFPSYPVGMSGRSSSPHIYGPPGSQSSRGTSAGTARKGILKSLTTYQTAPTPPGFSYPLPPMMGPSRSEGFIPPMLTSSVGSAPSPYRRSMSLNAGKTPLSPYENLPVPGFRPPSAADARSIPPSPLVFARPGSDASSVQSNSYQVNPPFIPPRASSPETDSDSHSMTMDAMTLANTHANSGTAYNRSARGTPVVVPIASLYR